MSTHTLILRGITALDDRVGAYANKRQGVHLCAEGLRQYFDIPDTAKRIWLVATDKPQSGDNYYKLRWDYDTITSWYYIDDAPGRVDRHPHSGTGLDQWLLRQFGPRTKHVYISCYY